MRLKSIREFIQFESISGIILLCTAILALIVSNSPWQALYQKVFYSDMVIQIGNFHVVEPLVEWINEGLMTVFFLLVGLEIKREILEGELNSWKKMSLPVFAALGGMFVPALIYIILNKHHAVNLRGWAIPIATDIAFALGILSLLRSKIPLSLKIFLTALSIFDDIGAVLIIALFYSANISWLFLGLAGICVLILCIFNYLRIKMISLYLLVALPLWFLIFESGIHASIAGVILAFVIPLHAKDDTSPLRKLEKILNPWVAFLVLPLFSFANAGVSFLGFGWKTFFTPITLGIALGLFLGKQLGIFGISWVAIKMRLAKIPQDANWRNFYGVALIGGIGFTMSLFIGALAFSDLPLTYMTQVRFGVLSGSCLSGLMGYLVLRYM